jgi:hypothetical protein
LAAQEDPDETLRRKTLDLLVKITNTQNVPVIIDKLVRYLRGTTDSFLRLELVSRMTQVPRLCFNSTDFYCFNSIACSSPSATHPRRRGTFMR